jgi:hypothetical protein
MSADLPLKNVDGRGTAQPLNPTAAEVLIAEDGGGSWAVVRR